MLEKDAILAKISIIKNCLKMIEKATGLKPDALDNWTTQDVFVLNLQRAIQAAIDMANLVISMRGYALPTSYKHTFFILQQNGVINSEIQEKMEKMVGFRNIAVHDYQKIDVNILKSIMKSHLVDIEEYYTTVFNAIQ